MATVNPCSVGLVLSGGGTRLFAHIGFLWALDDAGLLAPGQPIGAVVGNSAGSVVGSLLALGYAPREMWELAYWRAWGYEPLAEPRAWRQDLRARSLDAVLDLDFDGLAHALIHHLSHFKGIDSGLRFEALLQRVLEREGPDGAPNPDFGGTRPPEAGLPLYLIGYNLTNRRETIFRFTEHCTCQVPPLPTYPTPLGREASYELCSDVAPDGASPKELFRPWEAVRISTSLPLTFRPYFKPRYVATHWDEAGLPQPLVLGAYFSDGGSRDNYALSVALKLAGCDAALGCFLGSLSYPYDLVGTGTAIDVAMRNIDGMMHALFEADQDDAEILTHPVRTVVPHIPQRPGVTFDLSQVGAVMEAGYIASACYLRRLRPEFADDREFLAALVGGGVSVGWSEVVAWRDAGYTIVEPAPEFEEAARSFFAEEYPGVAAMAAPLSPLEEEIARRNRERREIAPAELDQPPFSDMPMAQAQRIAVAWGEQISWAACAAILGAMGSFVLAVWALLGHGLHLLPAPDPVEMWAAELLLLLVAIWLGRLVRGVAVEMLWEEAKHAIRSRVGF